MTLRTSEMNRLLADSSPMHSRNHGRWLSEAINCLRSTGEPEAAVTLLKKLREYNKRDDERRAINDVVGWIERRIRARPPVKTSRLMLELGWLRRMSVTRSEAHGDSSRPGDSRGGGRQGAGRGRAGGRRFS